MPTPEEKCLSKGWTWTGTTCQRPKITTLGLSINRGKKCGGSSKRRRVEKPKKLSLAVQDAILLAAEPKEKPEKPKRPSSGK
jgi:predicted metalloprotease